MIPGDTDSIRHEYEILLSELATFNPDMLSKERVLAITKCDLLDDELISLLEPELPTDIPHIFISAVTGFGVSQLKDILWQVLNGTSTRISLAGGDATEALVHRNISKEELDEINTAEGDLFVPDSEEEYEELEDFEYEFDEDDEDNFNDK